MSKQTVTRLKDQTYSDLEELSSFLSSTSGEKVDQSKIVRFAIHELLRNKKTIFQDEKLLKNFNCIVKAYDNLASMKAYDMTVSDYQDQMKKDLNELDEDDEK